MIQVRSVNISKAKGTIKTPAGIIRLTPDGVESDAHAGPWHRQVSLLGTESMDKFEHITGRKIRFGEFAENITTTGLELWKCHPLDRFYNDTIELEVTQIGKECHGSACTIFREVGNCVMPKEGIFARVLKGGELKDGDTLVYLPKTYAVHIVTLSDRAHAGIYEDLSGPCIESMIRDFFTGHALPFTIHRSLIPDDPGLLTEILARCRNEKTDVVITTGGTGIGPKDFTPEVMHSVIDKEIPGIMDHIRLKFGEEKPQALLSRSIAGVMSHTLVFALPGSVKAVTEYTGEILKSLMHMIFMLNGLDQH